MTTLQANRGSGWSYWSWSQSNWGTATGTKNSVNLICLDPKCNKIIIRIRIKGKGGGGGGCARYQERKKEIRLETGRKNRDRESTSKSVGQKGSRRKTVWSTVWREGVSEQWSGCSGMGWVKEWVRSKLHREWLSERGRERRKGEKEHKKMSKCVSKWEKGWMSK